MEYRFEQNKIVPSQRAYYLVWEPRIKKSLHRAFLVAQWERICLPMQEIHVQSLILEDFISCGVTKPIYHNCWSLSPPSLCSATREATALRSPRPQLERSPHSPEDPAQPKINLLKIIFIKRNFVVEAFSGFESPLAVCWNDSISFFNFLLLRGAEDIMG